LNKRSKYTSVFVIKISLFFLFSITISCGTSKNKIAIIKKAEQEKITNYIKAQNYTIELPNTWYPVLDHNFVSYTPKYLNDNFYKNKVKITNITTEEDKNMLFEKVVEKKINSYKENIYVTLEEIYKQKTHMGTTFIYIYTHSWNYVNYKVISKFFKYKNNYYLFTYSSDIKYFDKYLNDAETIYNALKFK